MQYVIQTLQKEMITRIKNRGPNAGSQEQNVLYAFNHTESRSRNIFYKHEYRQREIKIIFDTNRLPK